MKNTTICKNCGAENDFYKLTCSSCSSYLREKVFNIDLFNTMGLIVESPSKAFRMIVHSENKNYGLLLLLLISIKILINVKFASLLIDGEKTPVINYFLLFLSVAVITFVFFYLTSLIIRNILRLFKITTRIKDNLAVITYSHLPLIFVLIIFLPFEVILFGGSLFSRDPSPFIIKPALAYLVTGLEILIQLWVVVLCAIAAFVQSGSKIFSLFFTIIFHSVFIILIIILSKTLFF